MYKWYGRAAICYTYLADVPPGGDHRAAGSAFRKSRWFRRGWTLQELIAPLSVQFLSEDWAPISSKHALIELVESITRIDYKALLHMEQLEAFSVAQRLSWAANRETTRVEDRAYSLLGMFNINMPTLYGEGDHAFRRLQEQIMQRTPDQSLFVWEDVYLASRMSKIHDKWEVQPDNGAPNIFATSPDLFWNSHGTSTLLQAIKTTESEAFYGHGMIEYTSTPYGIRTQFWMIPLTLDLLLRATQHSGDIQLGFSPLPKDSQWYLAILKCVHSECPEHFLGRVCYTTPSRYNVDFVHVGYIRGICLHGEEPGTYFPDLFPLSPETIEHFRPQIELKTVYIPHPDRTTLSASSNLRRQPYTTIKLVLLTATRDALRPRGYKANLRDPGPDHPTTHWLTLSKDEHTITVEFKHTLKDGGDEFTINALVKMLGSHGQLDSTSDSNLAEHHRVSWRDFIGGATWESKLDHEKVRLSATGAGMLTVDLGLDFGGEGLYFVRVDVVSDALPASSAVELAVHQAEEGERTRKARHLKQSTLTMWFKRIGWEMAPSEEDGDVVASSDDMEDGDGDGVLA